MTLNGFHFHRPCASQVLLICVGVGHSVGCYQVLLWALGLAGDHGPPSTILVYLLRVIQIQFTWITHAVATSPHPLK